jgi:hypothetical protein
MTGHVKAGAFHLAANGSLRLVHAEGNADHDDRAGREGGEGFGDGLQGSTEAATDEARGQRMEECARPARLIRDSLPRDGQGGLRGATLKKRVLPRHDSIVALSVEMARRSNHLVGFRRSAALYT